MPTVLNRHFGALGIITNAIGDKVQQPVGAPESDVK
jgi:hypothetical protein